jgi:hypothetical protein
MKAISGSYREAVNFPVFRKRQGRKQGAKQTFIKTCCLLHGVNYEESSVVLDGCGV